MDQIGLSEICNTITVITDRLVSGEETCIIRDEHSLEDLIEFLRSFVVELKALDLHIAKEGNTPELIEEVYSKHTELWLFQLAYYIKSLPEAIGALMSYADHSSRLLILQTKKTE